MKFSLDNTILFLLFLLLLLLLLWDTWIFTNIQVSNTYKQEKFVLETYEVVKYVVNM